MIFYTINEANSVNAKYHGDKTWLHDPNVDVLRDRDMIYNNRQKKFDKKTFNGDYKKLPKEYRAAGCMIPVDYALGKKKVNTPDGVFHNYDQLPDDTDYIYIFLTWDDPDPEYVTYTHIYNKDKPTRVCRVYKDLDDKYFELYASDYCYRAYFKRDQKHKATRYFSRDEKKIIEEFFKKNGKAIEKFYTQPWYFFDYFQERNDLEVTEFEFCAFNFKVN